MTRFGIRQWSRSALAESWWVVPQALSVVAISLLSDVLIPVIVYAVINSFGVWAYADHHGVQNPRRQTLFKILAIPLLPVGFLGLVGTGGGPTISQSASGASSDESVRKATAEAAQGHPSVGTIG